MFACMRTRVMGNAEIGQKGAEKMKQYYSNHGSYRELLFDERWREKRMHILERDGYKCTIGSSSNLVVISFLFQLSSSFLILLKVVDMFAF